MKWNFPSNNYAQVTGITESGVETFRGQPLPSFAREICQNSIDATKKGEVTRIEFKHFQLNPKQIPDSIGLKDAFERSLDFWKGQNVSMYHDFFKKALEVINDKKIDFLRISDFNTTGLLGSEKNDHITPWNNLIKGSGVSDKYGTSGGSFGIGKLAPFTCSSFRTVFYSTVDTNGIEAFQGVSRLTSFKDKHGDTTFGIGYYGEKNNAPLLQAKNLDPSFQRGQNETGTDIFVAGFQYANTDWKREMVEAVLDGFLYAIFRGSLIVEIDDIHINKDTLPSLLEELAPIGGDKINSIINYYEILTSPSDWIEADFMNMGKIRLKLGIKEGYRRKVAMVRKTGMKIMDRGHISNVIPFAGVMSIEGDKINEFLRSLENPTHTAWQPKRLIGKENYAMEVLRNLGRFIIQALNDLSEMDGSEFIDLDVGGFLPDYSESDIFDKKDKRESLEKVISSVKKKKIEGFKRTLDLRPDDLESSEESLDGDGDEMSPTGSHEYSGKETDSDAPYGDLEITSDKGQIPQPSRSKVSVPASKVRVVCLDKKEGKYSIFFTPMISADNGELIIFMSAETEKYSAEILDVKCLGHAEISFGKNIISGFNFVKDNLIRLIVNINYDELCSLEVIANAIKI